MRRSPLVALTRAFGRARPLHFVADRRGVSAVEFALVMPLALLILAGEFTLGEAISINRKVSITAHSVADLVARRASVASSDVTTILAASAQVMAPYSTSNLVIVLAELTTDANSKTTVTWSKSLNGTALTAGTTFVLPTGVGQASTSLIYGLVTYSYTPIIGGALTGTLPITYAYYMNPRVTASVPLSN